MAQSVPPGDIQTHSNAKNVFNAPYGDMHIYHIKDEMFANIRQRLRDNNRALVDHRQLKLGMRLVLEEDKTRVYTSNRVT